jgi:hypothetical protein
VVANGFKYGGLRVKMGGEYIGGCGSNESKDWLLKSLSLYTFNGSVRLIM